MIPRIHVGKGVTGAARYILGEGRDYETGELRTSPAGEGSRVAWLGGTGFGFEIESREDADLARRIMEFDAANQTSRTKRCEKDCVHLSLGWRPGETPSREEMEAAAKSALKSLGMENAKAIYAAHNDEDYAHVHIVASKINPDTGRAYDLKSDRLKLSAWAERYEREHGGVVCQRREEMNALRQAIQSRDAVGVLDFMTEKRATFTARELDTALGKLIKPTLERAQFANQVLENPEVVRLSDRPGEPPTRYTTQTALEAERYVLRAAASLATANHHAITEEAIARVLKADKYEGLSREQARAIRHATCEGGLALIDGQAGTGKSYTMNAIREVYTGAGYDVIGLAPTNAVAQDLHADGFKRAGTVHSELFALNNERTAWTPRTVVMVDEVAMLDTRMLAMVTAHAQHAGAKLVLVGDDRQLASIDRGGMFGVLKDRYGAAELSEVRRQTKNDDRRAAELMAEGNFSAALSRYDGQGAIQWTRTQDEARQALVKQWAKDSAGGGEKSRFVFAYTNADVDRLNADLRQERAQRGELGPSHAFDTQHGRKEFAVGDRVQLTGTDKKLKLYNGHAGTLQSIEGNQLKLKLDGKAGRVVTFNAEEFKQFRHGYAGTIYKAQGRTLDQTYLYHSEHWRSASSYVALTRHRDKTALFVARNTAPDLKQLSRQMARVDERRAASHFHTEDRATAPVRPLTPQEVAARFNDTRLQARFEREQQNSQQTKMRREEEQVRHTSPAARRPGATPSQEITDEKAAKTRRHYGLERDDKDGPERSHDHSRTRDRGGRTR